ncbi:MAG: HDOD domain-containing protein, partial [Acidihalobacter sp.]
MTSVSASLGKAVDITRLPSLPQVLFRLLDACEDPDRSMTDIAALIRQDAALSSRVITLSSSPIYARQHGDRHMSLEQGLMLLGLDTTRTLALTAAVYQYMDRSLGAHSPHLRRFWHDALLRATLAERLAQLSGFSAPHEAHLGGLISNIGQVALLTVDPQGYNAVLAQGDDTESLLRHERAVFGHDHAELGAYMLQQSGRRGPLTDAVHFHHADPDELADAHHLVRLIATANALPGTDGPSAAGLVAAERTLGLIPSLVEEVYAAATAHAREACASLGIEPDAPAEAFVAPGEDQQRLSRRLAELNITSAVRRQLSSSDDLEALLTSAHVASTLLFGTHELGYFLFDRDRAKAVGHAVTITAPIWSELELQLPAPHSLVGGVLADARPRCHYPWNREHPDSAKPSVLDREITALLDRQGLLAIALKSGEDFEGVIVIGVNPEDEQRLEDRRPLLALFAQEIAASIGALRSRIEQRESAIEAQASEYRLQARSVVHEAKNPLSIINNYLAILGRHIEEGNADVSKDLRIIGEEITRVGAILRSLTETVEQSAEDDRTDLNT